MKAPLKPKKKLKKTPVKRAKTRAVPRPIIPDINDLRKLSESVTTRFYPISLPTQLFLFDVDPHCLHATWNIYQGDAAVSDVLASSSMSHEIFALRLYRVEPGGIHNSTINRLVKEIQVTGFSNAFYITPLHGGGVYQAELGLFDASNEFHSIIHSNTIHVPPPRIKRLVTPTPEWATPQKKATQKTVTYAPGTIPAPTVEWQELTSRDHATGPMQQAGTENQSTAYGTTDTQQHQATPQRGEPPTSSDEHYFSGNFYFNRTD